MFFPTRPVIHIISGCSKINSHSSKQNASNNKPMAGVASLDDVVSSLAVLRLRLQSSVSEQVQTFTVKTSLVGQDRPWASNTSTWRLCCPGQSGTWEWIAALVSGDNKAQKVFKDNFPPLHCSSSFELTLLQDLFCLLKQSKYFGKEKPITLHYI